MSCSATGKPAPKITWHLPSTLLQKPKEYHIKLTNQTITVISNFTHAHSKILKEYPIACVIQHPSLNVTLPLPMDNLTQGQYTNLLLPWNRRRGNISWAVSASRGWRAGGKGTTKRSWYGEGQEKVLGNNQTFWAMMQTFGIHVGHCDMSLGHQTPNTGLLVVLLVCMLAYASSPPLTQEISQGMSKMGLGVFSSCTSLPEHLLLFPQVRTISWHQPWPLLWGCWSL